VKNAVVTGLLTGVLALPGAGAILPTGVGGEASIVEGGSGQAAPAALRVRSAPLRRVPVVKQLLRNNCETAALSMLLAARGVNVHQLALQRRLARSGPLDPQRRATRLPIWGDPDRGFVGRANGGGTDGGFGVYQGPIRRLGLRYDVKLVNLTGAKPPVLYRRLRVRRPVMVWVGLSEGPYGRWRTPQGKTIGVNFGEHTVVLTGIRGDLVLLNDPLGGQRLTWTRAKFEQLWARLGRRALGL
jgi:uncharacterized protein YvpB